MAQIRWSVTSGSDLQEIEDFIARDSVLHAIAFIDRIVESAEILLKSPQIGRIVPEFNRPDLREVIFRGLAPFRSAPVLFFLPRSLLYGFAIPDLFRYLR